MFRAKQTPFDTTCDKRPLLSLALHTDSLRERILDGDADVGALLALRHFEFVELLMTPTRDPVLLARLEALAIENPTMVESNRHWVLVEKNRMRSIAPARSDVSYSKPLVAGSRVTELDLLVGRHEDIDLFVVDKADPFLSSTVRRDRDVEPSEAMDKLRVLAVNCGLFYVTPELRVNEGFYYLYRFKKVFHAFQKAYTTAVLSGAVPRSATDQLDSLAQRLEFICRAADRASYFSLRRADNDNQDNALYHSAFLIMLVTGAFDDIAWLISQIYSISVDKGGVSLRCLANNRANVRFFTELRGRNAALADYLLRPPTQSKLWLFYPARHRLQHGVFLETLRYSSPTRQIDKILLAVPQEAIQYMEEINGPTYRSDWKLIDAGPGTSIEPYHLVRKSMQVAADVVNSALPLFSWESVVAGVAPELRVRIETKWAEFDAGLGGFLGWPAEPIYF